MKKLLLAKLLCFCCSGLNAAEVEIIDTQLLPMFDQQQEGQLLTVTLKPGESSIAHRHNAHTFVYVIEGSVIMQLKGSDPVTLNVGDSFYESPDDIHLMSDNASKIESAKFVVFFVKPKGAVATELVQ